MIKGNKLLYISLALLATGASFQAMILPRWPVADPLPQKLIEVGLQRSSPGFRPLGTLPAKRSYDISSSEALRFSMADKDELTIRRSTVREFLNFRADYISKQIKELELIKSKTSIDPRFTEGSIDGRPALQTCVIDDKTSREPILGVTFKQLGEPIANKKVDLNTILKRFAGIEPSRHYSCFLITLISESGTAKTPAQLSELINKVSPYLY